jgi:hypothetical protein
MKIRVLGCGSAFSTENMNQQFLLEEGGRTLLVDCGYATPFVLKRAGIKITDVDDIYISHPHADHIGGLEFVAFNRYDFVNRPRDWQEHKKALDLGRTGKPFPRLIGHHQLLRDVWDRSLRGGLESIEGFLATMDTFFETTPLPDNGSIDWQGWKLETVQQVHVVSGNHIMWTFGLMLSQSGHKTVYLTTDTQYNSPRQADTFYKKADLIFQDCETMGVDMKARAYRFGSKVHASYAELSGFDGVNNMKLPADIKAKMWLSHYQDHVLEGKDFFGNPCDWDTVVKEDGFAGLCHVGTEIEV